MGVASELPMYPIIPHTSKKTIVTKILRNCKMY
jgi:hypothetical protein